MPRAARQPAAPKIDPAAAPARVEPWFKPPIDPDKEPELNEFIHAFALSPPFLVAWSIGYLSDSYLTLTMVLLATPYAVGKLVAALGGRGAWAKSPSDWLSHFSLPMSIWIPTLILGLNLSQGESDLRRLFMAGGVYLALVVGQFVVKKLGGSKEKSA